MKARTETFFGLHSGMGIKRKLRNGWVYIQDGAL